ncbi:MAG: hypothetical protein Q4A61_04580 [Porphyromonadaceae bacterium]|nr:hypothetical protein [Porphyromonadaceae bacterium]
MMSSQHISRVKWGDRGRASARGATPSPCPACGDGSLGCMSGISSLVSYGVNIILPPPWIL